MMAEKRPPIFIIGSPRSGTTLFRLILDSHQNISCGPETHILKDLSKVLGPYWVLLQRYGFEEAYWCERIASFFGGFQEDYAERRGKNRWADKTPVYALHLDFINRLFPNCVFIHVIRNGYDVVKSHYDRWGYRKAMEAAWSKWHLYVSQARVLGRGLPQDRYLEIRYEDLVTDTEKKLREVLDFLGEPWDPAVLDHQSMPHDVAELYKEQTDRRRRDGKDRRAVYRSRIGSGAKELDGLLKTVMNLTSGALLEELGYKDKG
jgi:hypothetical protein